MRHTLRRMLAYKVMAIVLLASMGCSMLQGVQATPSPENGVTATPAISANPQLVDVDTGTTTDVAFISGENGGDEDGRDGFTISLSEGSSTPQEIIPIEPVQGDPLTSEEIEILLARLPELEMGVDDQQEFFIPPDLLPPPRPGETIDLVFPPDDDTTAPDEVVSGPLEVLRYSPEGEISVAPFIAITFNQPMVPLATLQQLREQEVPVQVTPSLPGSWRWVGTKTLAFYYDSDLIDRLPKATEYTVVVPAGTRSANGGELAQEVRWTFTTPAPVLVNSYPYSHEPQDLEPVFFALFDQRIDPAAVLPFINASADDRGFSIRLATEDEITGEETVASLVASAPEGRWIAFKAVYALPKDSLIQVKFQSGMPSAEGELITQVDQAYSFRTYAPLNVVDYGCSWWGRDCYPLQPFFIEFNNPLDAEAYQENMISIDPPIAGAVVNVVGNTITIRGATVASTNYYVTVDASLPDVFGQTLGRDEKLTFQVGKAEALLIGPNTSLVTVDPYAQMPGLSVYSITYPSLQVEVYAVQPTDWLGYKEYLRDYGYNERDITPPGQRVVQQKIDLSGKTEQLAETFIDLSDVMEGEFGHFIVIVKPPKGFFEEERWWETVHAWVQVTQIGVDAFVDHSEMVVWATDLKDGTPLSGVNLADGGRSLGQRTDAEGIARFALPNDGIAYLVATLGDDSAILPRSTNTWYDDSWVPRPPVDMLRWYVFDDRAMYKPGEEVHLKGWLRIIGAGQAGDVMLPGSRVNAMNYVVTGPLGNEIVNGQVTVDDFGGFDLAFTVPENANLGYAYVSLTANGDLGRVDSLSYNHGFQIQEFRRPEFEVQAGNETSGPYYNDEFAITVVSANYYAGGPLPNAEVTWNVNAEETNYQPPNWPEFFFGEWTPWWWYDWYWYGGNGTGQTRQVFEGRTDASGDHFLRLDFDGEGVQRPQSVLAEAVVMDVNRQAWSGSTSLMVHPAETYVGMRSERYFVERGTPIEVDLIVTDIDGNVISSRPVTVTAERMQWKFERGSWREVGTDAQVCEFVSGAEPSSCEFQTELGGKYQITALVSDEAGRENRTRLTRWVSGGERAPSRGIEQETVTLIPDKEFYEPGDVAEILVQSPFGAGEGLLTVSRSGILYTERFTMTEDSTILRIPVEDAYIPNFVIQVDLAGSAQRLDDEGNQIEGLPPRPAFAVGSLSLSVPPLNRQLTVTAEAEESRVVPGAETSIAIEVLDASGAPVENASLAVVVVDEAILSLTNYQLSDPLAAFYFTRYADVSSTYGRASILLVDPMSFSAEIRQELMETPGFGGGAMDEAVEESVEMEAMPSAMAEDSMAKEAADGEDAAIMLRTDFNPLALFSPDVRTDEEGRAVVAVKMPDNLTRYRIMVVAVDEGGTLFGSGESNLTARLPLMVRPSAPRFLNFGDVFALPVVLQNQTDEDMTVEVIAAATNLTFTQDQGVRVVVPANDRVEVRFPVETVLAGTAQVMIAAVSGDYGDAALLSLPVYTPATGEAFAVYGVVDDGSVVQPLARPQDVFAQYGGLEITTSSTALQALTDAVLYLATYPFDSSEQMASRILGIAALREVLAAFEAEGLPSPEEMEASIERDVERLSAMQNYDGGFPYWRRGNESIPFHTVHVAHALQRAREMGFEVPENTWNQVLNYITYIEEYYPYWYSEQARYTISAYALYVRMRMGDPDAPKAAALLEDAGVEGISLDGLAFVWQVLAQDGGYESELEAIRRQVNNRAVETAGAANFTTGYSDDDYVLLHSNRRTDALLLDALINDNPQSDLIPKVVNGLMAHRTRGHWGNTQENVFVLLALHRYFQTYETVEPDFVARIWLGETYAGANEFEGYSTDYQRINIPMQYLMENMSAEELQDLVIQKDGDGRLYYRLGLRYAPTDLKLPPEEMGFVVQRVYEAVDDPDDVRLGEDGVWYIKAGARVRVRLTMVSANRRYHVALVDPLPAGLEIINPALAVSETIPADPDSPQEGWWWWRWYQHQNLRDERVEVFTQLLWEGVYEYTYVTRATTPGRFVAPPAKAEEMYSPEVFGRSAGDIVVIE